MLPSSPTIPGKPQQGWLQCDIQLVSLEGRSRKGAFVTKDWRQLFLLSHWFVVVNTQTNPRCGIHYIPEKVFSSTAPNCPRENRSPDTRQATFEVDLLLYVFVTHSVCRKGEGFSLSWAMQVLHGSVSKGWPLPPVVWERAESPEVTVGIEDSPPSPPELVSWLFCTSDPKPRKIRRRWTSKFWCQITDRVFLQPHLKISKATPKLKVVTLPGLCEIENSPIFRHREKCWCVPTCQRIRLCRMAAVCFCVCQSNLGSAFTDTWDQRAVWPDTLLLLPCSNISTGGYC